MNTNCICLEYIHDNGPCPIHGQPPTVDEEKELHINLAPRVLKAFNDEQLLKMTARRNGVGIEINPQNGDKP